MNDVSKEVQDVLSNQDIRFEEIAEEETSPLNQPVKEKEVSTPAETDQNSESSQTFEESGYEHTPLIEEQAESSEDFEQLDDVPEQQISDQVEHQVQSDEDDFEVPIGHAKQAADTFLGMADNLLEVGGGFFVKIRKHKDFYEFEELIQVIDEQNDKNVKRIKLDEEDKALLHPLLVTILRKRAKKLTPEQQLMGALISIMVKKAQVVMEVRAENEILVDRMLEIIREERGQPTTQQDYEPEVSQPEQNGDEQDHGHQQTEVDQEQFPRNSVLEVAEDEESDTSENNDTDG